MNTKKLLSGKVSIITGASQGIGAQIAKTFAEHGSKIAICYSKSFSQAQSVKKVIQSIGCEAEIFQCNIEELSSIKETIKLILKKFKSIYILVNNAGVVKQTDFEKITEDEYNWIMEVNLKGSFFFTQHAIPYLLKSQGTIINISSVGGQRGGTKAIHYVISKAAIISFTKSLSNLYAPKGIRVNAIAPGQIMTGMTKELFETEFYQKKILPSIPLKRIGTTEDVANAALFLASDLSSYITGQTINVNGGEYLL